MTRRVVVAWAVHLYTAAGAVLGAGALVAAAAGDFRSAWLLIYATIWIDSTDGFLARVVRVEQVLPGIDGRRLDDIVDYLCWVFVPVVLLVLAGRLPGWVAPAPLLASAYGFARVDAKTAEGYFLGFPSYWSLVGFYLYEFTVSQRVGTVLVLVLSALVFVPLRFPYPTRTRPFRPLTLALGALWSLCLLVLMLRLPDRPRAFALLSLYYPLYYVALTVWLWWRGHPERARERSTAPGG